ncbi:hypothetical protein GCM10010222_80590 [Streptomyces tanashiensis]|uniref:hypothetical protein n=1 Tax=Streptomyces tanashiensis TaxID=67367 RepID=UPI00167AA8AD|nr:hypothetical protein [Streptomyces tanashiensis]GGT26698.1 hypothetical protein GCM10010222_80590 [Streptomyces tanashiensis]
MSWQREGFETHEGEVGVLLADGSEPGPVFFDLGSGAYFHESTDWWVYDGSLRRPTATSMRGKCACGWRGERTVPLDWEQVLRAGREAYDISGPERDWEAHMDDVATGAVPLPDDVAGLLRTLRGRLDELVDDEPLLVLRAAEEMEAIVADFGPIAARYIAGDAVPLPRLAEALGTTEKAAGARMAHYRYLNR